MHFFSQRMSGRGTSTSEETTVREYSYLVFRTEDNLDLVTKYCL